MEAITGRLGFQIRDVNVAGYVGYSSVGEKENSEAQCSIKTLAFLPPQVSGMLLFGAQCEAVRQNGTLVDEEPATANTTAGEEKSLG